MAFLTLFEPEIPFNVGAVIRLSACFSSKLAIIRPTGFVWDVARMKRSAMDYLQMVDIKFYNSFDEFKLAHDGRILATAIGTGHDYAKFEFQSDDAILIGRESIGLTKDIYSKVDEIITIPINARSLNLALASAILLSRANS